MDTQRAGYPNKLLEAVAQMDYTGGFVCLRRRLIYTKTIRLFALDFYA